MADRPTGGAAEGQPGPRSAIDAFWDSYACTDPNAAARGYCEAFRFGNTERMANELAALVAQGVKTATSALLWSYQEGERLLQEGDLSIVTTWDNEPVCIVETTELRIVPFKDVDARFAYDYGEGDRTLEWWREHLWAYYAEECDSLGREPTEEMPLVCERFRVVYPPQSRPGL